MKADEFINKLKSKQLDDILLKGAGFDINSIENYKSAFRVTKRRDGLIITDNPILDLITNYDVTNVNIGMVSFNQEIISDKFFFRIGKFEIDDLVIKKEDGEVLILEASTEYTLWHCAYSSDNFLKAILYCVDVFNDNILIPERYNDIETLKVKAKECADLAGGLKYLSFFETMFAV